MVERALKINYLPIYHSKKPAVGFKKYLKQQRRQQQQNVMVDWALKINYVSVTAKTGRWV